MDRNARPTLRVRTAFLSDLHLGTRECRVELIGEFLDHLQAERLVLVGDVVDLWSLRRSHYWPAAHDAIVHRLLERARSGLPVIYVPGNHDESFRKYAGTAFGELSVQRRYEHACADGRRYLVVHGDEFEGAVECSRWLAAAGCAAYDLALALNRGYNRVRRAFGYGYWSLAGYLKSHIAQAARYVERYEQAAARHAGRHGYDGIICGHIHRPARRWLHGVEYCNTGDWVDSCSALVEDYRGGLRLLSLADWQRACSSPGRELRAA